MTQGGDTLVLFVLLGVLLFLLRWTFSRGHSLVERSPRRGDPGDYGLLVPVARPTGTAEARASARLLTEAGIRCTLVHTTRGVRLMVWPDHERRAREILSAPDQRRR